MAEVHVRYFAAAEEAAGRPEERLDLPEPTIEGLQRELVARYGEPMERVVRSGSFLVGGIVSRDPSRELTLATPVDVLPPFAGG
ncbi:MoaD/ThiS family protein [Leifsonia shinshuensis]|uniref:MoaD/ThiS family protein n=1 Tax=Leifsonia TaxID=110932 RepID=UPI00285F5DF6|nr:MoaD/ThiS family protein [Leifsonia shinshuensis]MDR6969979.1 molybdopterin converting factor small subunit [Leifsonia shinshuensis]